MSHSPGRLLLRGGPRLPKAPKASRPTRAASTGPAAAARDRARGRGQAQSPLAARRRPPEPARTTPPPPPAPERPPLKDLPDDDLATLYTQAVTDGDDTLAEQVMAELDRRDEQDDAWGSPQDAAALIAAVAGQKRKPERELAKEAYQDWLQAYYLRADEATGGVLLNKAGIAAGYSGDSILNGTIARPQVKKYASEEYLRWVAEPGNGRMTETEFVNQWLGKETVADRDRRRSPLSEF